jgi:chromosome segregation ATPase
MNKVVIDKVETEFENHRLRSEIGLLEVEMNDLRLLYSQSERDMGIMKDLNAQASDVKIALAGRLQHLIHENNDLRMNSDTDVKIASAETLQQWAELAKELDRKYGYSRHAVEQRAVIASLETQLTEMRRKDEVNKLRIETLEYASARTRDVRTALRRKHKHLIRINYRLQEELDISKKVNLRLLDEIERLHEKDNNNCVVEGEISDLDSLGDFDEVERELEYIINSRTFDTVDNGKINTPKMDAPEMVLPKGDLNVMESLYNERKKYWTKKGPMKWVYKMITKI